MQLITATLSPVALSCAIGSTSSRDLWIRLKEQFSTVSKTSIFQMKSNLHNIKKGADSVSQYLHRIKEARDYLSAAGVYFLDEDIVILALNGLPSEYNTFRTVIRGRESVITLKEFRSQLLAEEIIVENSTSVSLMSAMVATNQSTGSRGYSQSNLLMEVFPAYNGNKNRGRGKYHNNSRSFAPKQMHSPQTHVFSTPTSGILGSPPAPFYGAPSAPPLPPIVSCATLKVIMQHFVPPNTLTNLPVPSVADITTLLGIAFIMKKALILLVIDSMLLNHPCHPTLHINIWELSSSILHFSSNNLTHRPIILRCLSPVHLQIHQLLKCGLLIQELLTT